MARKRVSLYFDDTGVRLLVIQKNRVKEWATLPLEQGLIKNNVVNDEIEVAARIRQLLKSQRIKTKKVSVGISGLLGLSRPILLPSLPREMLAEVIEREAKRLLPVPIETLYLSWQSIKAPAGKSQAFLAAVPRNSIDTIHKTLCNAGIQPYYLSLKPLLLAKLFDQSQGIIIDVQSGEFDIVVMYNGIPQPIRTVSFANEELSWREKQDIIVNDTERTISFYNSNNSENSLSEQAPIAISGDTAFLENLSQTLAQKTARPIQPLPQPFSSPESFIPGQFIANLSLSKPVPKVVLDPASGSSIIDLNLLPLEYRPKQISLFRILAIPVTVVLAGLIAFLYILMGNEAGRISTLQDNLSNAREALQQRLHQRQALADEVSQLQLEVEGVKTESNRFATAAGQLQIKTSRMNEDLNTAMNFLPLSITITSISHDGNLLVITGNSISEGEILSYVKSLENSQIFADVTVTNIVRNDDDTMEFSILGDHTGASTAVGTLEIVLTSLPSDVSLTQVVYGKDTIMVSASTNNQDSIVSFVNKLEVSTRFSDIIISEMTNRGTGRLEFNLSLHTSE